MSPEDERVVQKFREKIFQGPDRDLYLHVGFFFLWFNAVEFKLTYFGPPPEKWSDLNYVF
ncbi:MAG: hypothetical protein P8Y71_13985 [Pseudolabrys sp.]